MENRRMIDLRHSPFAYSQQHSWHLKLDKKLPMWPLQVSKAQSP